MLVNTGLLLRIRVICRTVIYLLLSVESKITPNFSDKLIKSVVLNFQKRINLELLACSI